MDVQERVGKQTRKQARAARPCSDLSNETQDIYKRAIDRRCMKRIASTRRLVHAAPHGDSV